MRGEALCADRTTDKVDGARQSATKKLGCLLSFDLLELRAADLKEDGSLQHLEPGWYLVGLPMHDHNEDCSNRAYAKAAAINTRADSAIPIPRAMVTPHIRDEMLDAAVPLFLYSKMPVPFIWHGTFYMFYLNGAHAQFTQLRSGDAFPSRNDVSSAYPHTHAAPSPSCSFCLCLCVNNDLQHTKT